MGSDGIAPKYPDRDPDLFYELARDRHAAQAGALGSLDTKLAFFLTSSSALLGILVAVYALRPNAFHTMELILLGASGGAWLVLTARALYGFRHRTWKSGPILQEFYDLYFVRDERRLKWIAANRFWGDYNDNKPLEDQKASALTWALCLFVIQTCLLIAALVVVAVSQSSESSRHSRPPGRAARDAPVLAPDRVSLEKCQQEDSALARFRSSAEDLTP